MNILTGSSQNDQAIQFQNRACEALSQSEGPNSPFMANCLESLGSIYSNLGQHDIASELNELAFKINVKTFGVEHPRVASSGINRAREYSKVGRNGDAQLLRYQALEIQEKVLGKNHPQVAYTLIELTGGYIGLAEYEQALRMAQRADGIIHSSVGMDHPEFADLRFLQAYILQKLGHPKLAILFFKDAVNGWQMQRERISGIGSDELASYTQRVSNGYRQFAELLTENSRLAEALQVLDMLKEDEQFEFIRRSSISDPRSTRIGYNATELGWMNRYRQIADQLAELGAEGIALQDQVKLGLSEQQKQRQRILAADLKVAQKAFDSFLGEMREGFARQNSVRTVETEELSQKAMRDQQDLIASLGSDVVLLRYYVTDDKVGMLLTTAGVSLAHSTTINAKELNRQVVAFRSMLLDRKSNPLTAAQALYKLLVAPVANDIEKAGAKTVMLSLDGALRYLPFAALHDGQRYLVERWSIPMYTSVTKNRLRDAVTPQWKVAGFGVTRKWGNFDALPAVKSELGSIVKAAGRGVSTGAIFLDDAFTAQRFKDASASVFQIVHVASHFQFSAGGTEANSFLLLGDGQELTLADIRTNNYRFDNVDLLTLSACETGLGGGRDANGREIEGFGVIAQQQGAKAVLATLWSVADKSTATLMTEMYRQRQEKKLTKIDALRQAQLSLLANPRYQHPFYWAPFILMGNWK